MVSSQIPYATEQGIFKRVSGKISQGTGNFRAKLGISNFEQPQGCGEPAGQGRADGNAASPPFAAPYAC
jgi:hypothetical protein